MATKYCTQCGLAAPDDQALCDACVTYDSHHGDIRVSPLGAIWYGIGLIASAAIWATITIGIGTLIVSSAGEKSFRLSDAVWSLLTAGQLSLFSVPTMLAFMRLRRDRGSGRGLLPSEFRRQAQPAYVFGIAVVTLGNAIFGITAFTGLALWLQPGGEGVPLGIGAAFAAMAFALGIGCVEAALASWLRQQARDDQGEQPAS